MDRFVKGEIGSGYVAYMRFVSVGRQKPTVLRLLPLSQEEGEGGADEATTNVQFEFSPEPKELLEELLPATVRVRLFQCFTEANASEQIARMVAMKAATEAAGEMITTLTASVARNSEGRMSNGE